MKRNHEHLAPRVAIASIIGGVALYDTFCDRGETISEETDRLQTTKLGKYVVPFVVATTALHLLRAIPPEYDWLHRLNQLKRS